jgi:hypothetical protein
MWFLAKTKFMSKKRKLPTSCVCKPCGQFHAELPMDFYAQAPEPYLAIPVKRTSMVALNARDGETWVAWRQDDRVKWQLYDEKGRPVGSVGSAKSSRTGVAGLVDKNGHFVVFR